MDDIPKPKPKPEQEQDDEVTEYEEEQAVLNKKVNKLAEMINNSNCVVFYTGAGISTSANIPDFRGPNGVWTLRDQGKAPPALNKALSQFEPTLCHMAMVQLINKGKVHFLTSQNVDGLHLKSGIPSEKLAELHGNCFLETCEKCHRKYYRSFSVPEHNSTEIDVSSLEWSQIFHMTGRLCKDPSCKGILRDSIINFGETLPAVELNNATENAKKSDLAVCWGSSLRVSPACDLPRKTKKKAEN